MTDYRITAVSVPAKIPFLNAWNISINDDGGGEFVAVRDPDGNVIRIDTDEWSALRASIDFMVKECRDE